MNTLIEQTSFFRPQPEKGVEIYRLKGVQYAAYICMRKG